MGWRDPREVEDWLHFSVVVGAEFVEGGLLKGSKVRARVDAWVVTLDAIDRGEGDFYTRMRAPFVNLDGFQFRIYRKGLLSGLGKWLGMQDIEVDEPEFDEAFVIQGNDEPRVRQLFADPTLRGLVVSQPEIELKVTHRGMLWPRSLHDVLELEFLAAGMIGDQGRLKSLLELFRVVLERLCQIGSASREAPGMDV
jgi:hypothetical protein